MRNLLLLLSLFFVCSAGQCPQKNAAPNPIPKETPKTPPIGNASESGTGTPASGGQTSGQAGSGQNASPTNHGSPNAAPNQAQLDSIKLEKLKQKGKQKAPEGKQGGN